MTGEISSNYGAVIGGTSRAMKDLPTSSGGKTPAPGADPRLTAAVGDTDEQNRKGRDKIRAAGAAADKNTKGLAGLQEDGANGIKGIGKGDMPSMPAVPQSGESAPAAAESAPAPAAEAAPVAEPPAGVTSIDPQLLQALIQATQERAGEDAEQGLTPGLSGDPADQQSATSPQNPQALSASQVSLQKHGGGPLSKEETASVIDQALTINGVPNDANLREQWQALYQHMADNESSRNPDAANNSDSNATGAMMSDGAYQNSSRGIWQCIPSTFGAYHMGGTSTSIYDPVASAAASMNYVMHTYHVDADGDGLAAFSARSGVGTTGYTGY